MPLNLAVSKCTGRPLPHEAAASHRSEIFMQGGTTGRTDLAPTSIALHHVAPDDSIPQPHRPCPAEGAVRPCPSKSGTICWGHVSLVLGNLQQQLGGHCSTVSGLPAAGLGLQLDTGPPEWPLTPPSS